MVSTAPSMLSLSLLQPDRDYMVLVQNESNPKGELVLVGETEREYRDVWYDVLAIGPGRITPEGKTIPPNIKAGDCVLLASAGPRVRLKAQRGGETVEFMVASSQFVLALRSPDAPEDIRWAITGAAL